MRGKLTFMRYNSFHTRITPAYAGKTLCRQTTVRRLWDHPRVCGENARSLKRAQCVTGSPPRMRGKQRDKILVIKPFGITPAYAGKTNINRAARHNAEDHPRVCGENMGLSTAKATRTGSPPRMRGKHRNCRQYAYQHRITPAYAGKTYWATTSLELS